MKIAVCIKQVPTREWHPRINEAGTWIREQDASYELNEPDAYALEEALRLREKHSGEVVVCAAGPARVQQVIREALARGADRAIHVEDDALGSADASLTSAALASAMTDERFDLVLTGLQSDDQGHAQVGVMLAERLQIPHSTIIMEVQVVDPSTHSTSSGSMVSDAEPSTGSGQAATLRVKRELEGGWFQWIGMPLPALLTIQSGINQLRYATLKGIMAAKKKEIRKVPLPGGLAASQQIVALALPTRSKQTEMITGAPAAAAKELVRRLREEARAVILVVAEQRDGTLNRATLETIAAAQTLAGDAPVKAVVLGQSAGAVAQDLATAVSEVLLVESPALGIYTPDAFTTAVQQVVASVKPVYVLLPHTYQTRDFAPMVAVRMGASLITDVVGINGTGSSATFVRPMFQGKLSAEVRPQGEGPRCVTIQIGAFRADAVKRGDAAPVNPLAVDIDPSTIRQKAEAPFKEAKQAVDLGQAERIVAVGRGIKSQENIAIAEKLATAMSAEIAASRPICDSGWLPMDRQIGSSGQTVAPKLYVALGISGAIQHLVGMKGARTIVAINKDADAPIFEVADYGIVGDLFEIVPALIAEIEKT